MAETVIGKAVIRHADTLLSAEEAEVQERAKAEEIGRRLAEIGARKPGELTLADINAKLDLILERLGIR